MLDYAHPRYLFVFEAVIRIIDLTKNGGKRNLKWRTTKSFGSGWDYGFDLIILIKFDLNVD